MVGGAGDDTLSGGAGNDTLAGGAGADALDGGLGADVADYSASASAVTVYLDGTAGTGGDAAGDTLANIETLRGSAHDDTLHGSAGADSLVGQSGNDTLIGGEGHEISAGGTGNDTYIVTDASDAIIEKEAEGFDTVITGLNVAELAPNVEMLVFVGQGAFKGTGNALDNIIQGGNAADHLFGAAGDDILDGGEGDDIVLSGSGNDYVMFTLGNDTLVLMPGFGQDTALDFDAVSDDCGFEQDLIDVSAYGFSADALGLDILLVYEADGTVVHIGSDCIRLVKVNLSDVDGSDFIFA